MKNLTLDNIKITFDELLEEFDTLHDWMVYAVPLSEGCAPLKESEIRLNQNVSPELYKWKLMQMSTIYNRMLSIAKKSNLQSQYSVVLSCAQVISDFSIDITRDDGREREDCEYVNNPFHYDYMPGYPDNR